MKIKKNLISNFISTLNWPLHRHFSMKQSGAAILELALILPVLALITLSIWDYGRNLILQQEATRILYEGLRYAAKSDKLATRTSTPNLPRKYTEVGSLCTVDTDPQCPKDIWDAMKRMTGLFTFTYGTAVTVSEIIIDYDVTRNESGEEDNGSGDTGPTQPCQRTLRGMLKYSAVGFSIFKSELSGTVTARVPYFHLGENEDGILCGKAP